MKDLIINEIQTFVNSSHNNQSLGNHYRYFDKPLIGFANINDPIFMNFKEKIGEFYLLPGEWLDSEFGPNVLRKGTVISWILPINETVLASNRLEKTYPSREENVSSFV